jgi:cytochrome c biogenesis protein ResB
MHRAQDYLQRAAHADQAAAKAVDAEVKRDWQRIADQWRVMARQAEYLAAGEAGRNNEIGVPGADGPRTVLLDGDDAVERLKGHQSEP